jgi:hypothetical protein
VALLATSFAYGFGQQTPTKRPLRHQDYDSWRSIQAPQISRDGKFVAYAFMAQDGDSEIVARNVATGAEWRVPRGYHPPVPPPDDPGANIGEFQATQARMTIRDSSWCYNMKLRRTTAFTRLSRRVTRPAL